ncbi:hypothetical protein HPB50_004954 [Hyalomma asiaticum]|uniref:Uncharacterized protein n=1 Tax=Hyalomma asiaticum TaxID=266040 RepID=A0ACB7RRZ8_HYAAI|nr:hypothetical protein HPB50_004954 [Hyalomma asiaticum]
MVVGALGTWGTTSDWVMCRFTSNAYIRLFKRLCEGPAIKPIGWTSTIAVVLPMTRAGKPTTTSLAHRSGGSSCGVFRKFCSVDNCGSSRRLHHMA